MIRYESPPIIVDCFYQKYKIIHAVQPHKRSDLETRKSDQNQTHFLDEIRPISDLFGHKIRPSQEVGAEGPPG